ncbi:hypothetical protein D3C80_1423880 [compost metagenome]
MNQRDVNFVSMCRAVQQVLTTYQTTWAAMPAFVVQANRFTQMVKNLDHATEGSEIVTNGITDQKSDIEGRAVLLAVNLAKRASVYALEVNDLALHEQLSESKTSLLRRPDNLTLSRLRDIHSRLNAIVGQLGDYFVRPGDLAMLDELNNAFEQQISTPRTAIVVRKGYNQDAIPGLLADIRLCLYKMDNLVNLFASTRLAPEYKHARITVDAGLRHDPPPAEG